MPEPIRPPSVVRFGLFEVDLPGRELRKNGSRVKLQDRPFEVLRILIERPGELVTREVFRQRLWPADTFVDFDHSLAASINKLRQALDDVADNPRFIATVGRRGYKFIAPVNTGEFELSLENPPAASPEREKEATPLPAGTSRMRTRRARLARLSVMVLAGIVLIAAGILGFRELSPLPPPRVVRIIQLSNSGRADDFGRLTTDGLRVFFLERERDHWNLVQTSTNGGEVLPVGAALKNTRILDISPDNTEFLIGTFDHRWQELPLSVMPVQGGAPRRVGDLKVREAVWSPDGNHIFYGENDGLYVADQDGSNAHRLIQTRETPSAFAWSPDGRGPPVSAMGLGRKGRELCAVGSIEGRLEPPSFSPRMD